MDLADAVDKLQRLQNVIDRAVDGGEPIAAMLLKEMTSMLEEKTSEVEQLRQHVVALEHELAALAKKCISLEVELHAAHSEQARASRASSTVFTEGPRYPAYALVPTG